MHRNGSPGAVPERSPHAPRAPARAPPSPRCHHRAETMDAMGRVALAACASAAASSAAPPASSKRGRGRDDGPAGGSADSASGRGGGSADFDDLLSSLTQSLGALSTKEPTNGELVSTFTQVLDIAPSQALFMLTSANYDLATALSLYLDSQEADAPSRRRRVGPAQDRQIEITELPAGWMAFVCSTRHTVVSTRGFTVRHTTHRTPTARHTAHSCRHTTTPLPTTTRTTPPSPHSTSCTSRAAWSKPRIRTARTDPLMAVWRLQPRLTPSRPRRPPSPRTRPSRPPTTSWSKQRQCVTVRTSTIRP